MKSFFSLVMEKRSMKMDSSAGANPPSGDDRIKLSERERERNKRPKEGAGRWIPLTDATTRSLQYSCLKERLEELELHEQTPAGSSSDNPNPLQHHQHLTAHHEVAEKLDQLSIIKPGDHPAPIYEMSKVRVKLEKAGVVKVVALPLVGGNIASFHMLVVETFSDLRNEAELRRGNGVGDHLQAHYLDASGDQILVDDENSFQQAIQDIIQHNRQIITSGPGSSSACFKFTIVMKDTGLRSDSGRTLNLTGKATCHHFQVGRCRYGANCKNYHEAGGNRSSSNTGGSVHGILRSPMQIENWLQNQLKQPASQNIISLGSEEGIKEFTNLLEQSNSMSRTAIQMVIRLLGKEEIRSSMMAEHLNRIYGILPNSAFLTSLTKHIQTLSCPNAIDLQAYIWVLEEVQNRTADGWKLIPLDAVKAHIDSLPENAAKTVLVQSVSRLVQYREKLRRRLATEKQSDDMFKGKTFQTMKIEPSEEELLTSSKPSHTLPVNLVGKRYGSILAYLETHFQLLREDFLESLRSGIQSYARQVQSSAHHRDVRLDDVRVYRNVKLAGLRCGSLGMESRISFDVQNAKRISTNTNSKALMFGSLVCFSDDGFRSVKGCATISNRKDSEVAKGMIDVRSLDRADGLLLEAGKVYVMVESTSAYYEAYSHVLKCLQREEMEQLAFSRNIIDLEPQVNAPNYLSSPNLDAYDMSCIFPELEKDVGRKTINVSGEWPPFASTLDHSQLQALKHALTKEMSLIQGPPGTGKTFLGLLAIRVLLANYVVTDRIPTQSSSHLKYRVRSLVNAKFPAAAPRLFHLPILVVCFTNHALDQFLEGIYAHDRRIVRLGGRSKSATLQSRSLSELKIEKRDMRSLDSAHYHELMETKGVKYDQEMRITELHRILGAEVVTKRSLHGVATEDQISHLFFNAGQGLGDGHPAQTPEEILRGWLDDFEFDPTYRTNPRGLKECNLGGLGTSFNQQVPESYNPFAALEDWNEGSTDEDDEDDDEDDSPVEDINTIQGENILRSLSQGEETVRPDDGQATFHKRVGLAACSLEDLLQFPNVWLLDRDARHALHRFWLKEVKRNAQNELQALISEYEDTCRKVITADNEIDLHILREAHVVGVTTTSAAKYHDLLVALKPEIVIVEEAAEVLEAHIVACLSPSTKHLILIGDHLQLRPTVAVYDLAIKHHLDVSLFERLVKGGVEHVTLEVQRRMRPSIAKLIAPIYGSRLKNHSSVADYEDVKGVKGNVFFFDHKAQEDSCGDDAGGKKNVEEARLVVQLCSYLLKQGYSHKQITVLTMYSGQVSEIKKLLEKAGVGITSPSLLSEEGWRSTSDFESAGSKISYPTVSSVDNFQGEECDIVILSLVRSNTLQSKGDDGRSTPGKIGFLKIENRVCVALSRARMGLYIFGNAELLCSKSKLWSEVIDSLQEMKSLGPELTLRCQNHPDLQTKITRVADFKLVQDGGCNLPCLHQLDCGHACTRRCHPGGHGDFVCPKPCEETLELCGHKCRSLCHGDQACPSDCKEKVTRLLPKCGHTENLYCSTNVDTYMCLRPCEKVLECNHPCLIRCGNPCTPRNECKVKIRDVHLDCGHQADLLCSQSIAEYLCKVPCTHVLPDCGHLCRGTCGSCKKRGSHHVCKENCGRVLPCLHLCEAGCNEPCPPCDKKCRRRCIHSQCSHTCGDLCLCCIERCAWRCKHHRCKLRCYQICQRPQCNKPCTKILKGCHHPCSGLCGEPCPKCRVCHPEEFDVIAQMQLQDFEADDRFIQLQDCGHVFEVTGLDAWMQLADDHPVGDADAMPASSVALTPKQCPACKTPVHHTLRYSATVKTKLAQIDEVKRRIRLAEKIRTGNRMLQNAKNYTNALACFTEALRLNPDSAEAQYGVGCALYYMNQFQEAISSLRLVVGKYPPLAPAIASMNVAGNPNPNTSQLGRGSSQQEQRRHSLLKTIGVMCTITSVDKELGIAAALQWAQILSKSRLTLGQASLLCDAVLQLEPGWPQAQAMKKMLADSTQYSEVIEVVTREVGGRGHWYKCPNGHLYVVGECGGPMQTAQCPECRAVIGGTQHQLADGNTHADVDGSTYSAWSDAAGLHGAP